MDPTDAANGMSDAGTIPDSVSGADGGALEVVADQVLEPGGVAVTESGFGIGADADALGRFVAVRGSLTESPSSTPLPPEATEVGERYTVVAGRDIDLPSGGPALYLAVPVPEGADLERLALGVRVENLRPHITGDTLSGVDAVWVPLPSLIDPDTRVLVAPVHFLTAAGSEFVLLQSDDYDPVMLPSIGNTNQQQLLKSVADFVKGAVEKGKEFIEEGGEKKEDFYVKCRGFDSGECTAEAREEVRQYLLSVYEDFVPDFHTPDLRRTLPGREVDGEQGRYYLYVLRKDFTNSKCDDDTSGVYIPVTHTAVTCWDIGEDDLPSEETTRMEFFHAIQYNYPPVSWSNGVLDEEKWIIEGTASFVENPASTSDVAFRDPRRPLRAIDVPLTEQDSDGNPAYRVQDFWVYLINERGQTPLDILEPTFDRQSDTSEIPSYSKIDSLFQIRPTWWAWVKNQAFEATMTQGFGDALGDTCVPNPDAWSELADEIVYETDAQSSGLTRAITVSESRAARVYAVKVRNTFSNDPVQYSLDVEGDLFGRVKAYKDRASVSADCLNRDEDSRSTHVEGTLDAGQEQLVYVLAGNPTGGDRVFDLGVEHTEPTADNTPPTATIVSPRPSDEPLIYGTVPLVAEASDPGFIADYEWTISDGASSVTYTGNDLNVYPFADVGGGVWDITVEVTDDDGDSIEVTVEREVYPAG